jgi:hypothetical protein
MPAPISYQLGRALEHRDLHARAPERGGRRKPSDTAADDYGLRHQRFPASSTEPEQAGSGSGTP